jgi:hypothetical protein
MPRKAAVKASCCCEFEQRPESESFLQWVDVLALQIFNALGFDGLRVREFDDADGKVFEFRDAGGPQTTRSGYDFVFAFLQFAHQQGRENALCFETSGQFFQGSLIEPFAWIRARLDQCGD